ncbi:VOC family protein [Streptomyces sp. NPDC048723]|uniref:VOC family protein n=1 Tax=unclassified Streptomyces TaxID=2593676 RepID=UPI000AE7B251
MIDLALHHVGIQTADLRNSIDWYTEFFDAECAWTLDAFSELTLERLPGITELAEIKVGSARFHLFERSGIDPAPADSRANSDYQHVCLVVDSPQTLKELRERWFSLHGSGRFAFAGDELPTDIVVDDDGVESFYALDPSGLEFEITYSPVAHR